MKESLQSRAARRPRRVGVAQAKAKLSEVLRSLGGGPVVIHSRGRDVGALVDIESYERLIEGAADRPSPGGAGFLAAIERLRQHHRGGVDDFAPGPAVIVTRDPFRPTRRR